MTMQADVPTGNGTARRAGMRGWAVGAALLLAMPGAAGAQMAGDAAAGQTIAQRWCVNCHVVGRDQTRGTSNGAPSFPAIARRTEMTPMALRAFLQTPHHRMPDLQLSREQIDDVTAYIQSLRQPVKK
ncbi:c-type cytochrome [Rhodopila sp.]|jgi:mono/diheme cytochrome c family protein|uniref:c-type cytochrome n=1 Tax=Rhodopila sp. TaxID=2480087 RepID=UPI002B74932F|nr:c-type cytochrome [Rhodopila sp.]HVZ09465.1 c-type cytochrome [Rhodopila sp.]